MTDFLSLTIPLFYEHAHDIHELYTPGTFTNNIEACYLAV
jgi:hypothetical protein